MENRIQYLLLKLKIVDVYSYSILALLIKFLKRNNALHNYLINISKQPNYRKEFDRLSVYSLLNIRRGSLHNKNWNGTFYSLEFINYAFNWSETDEGHTYWAIVNSKWKQTVENFNQQYLNAL